MPRADRASMSHAHFVGRQEIGSLQLIFRPKRLAACNSLRAMVTRKTVHLLRHGKTEMNVFLEEHGEGCEDPLL